MFLWTDDRVATLKRLWASGVSCSRIAKELGVGCTKISVVGKAHRLQLDQRRISNANPEHMAARISARRKAISEASMSALGVSILDLGNKMCRWPTSDDKPFVFCAKPWASDHGPYCADHKAIAYVPAPKRRIRAAPESGPSGDWPPFQEAA